VTDAELVDLARQGDSTAFDQLVVRYQSAAFRAALAALRSPQDAEEAVQDAFVRAWSRLDQFRGEASFSTWLLTIVWNQALTRRRGLARWWKRHAASEEALDVAADSGPREALDGELRRHAVAAIERLSPKLRDALLLAQSGDYDYATIAGMLKVPVGTVKWRVSEARRKVRERLAALGYIDAR
jgi:RNA polymerase sigma-70 factor (ECF subfamily)